MQDSRIDELSERLARLERTLVRYRRIAAGAIVCAGVLLAWAAFPSRPAKAQQAVPDIDGKSDALVLYEEQHRLSQRALAIIDKSISLGAAVPDAPGAVAEWSHRLLGADIFRSFAKGQPRTADPEVYLSSATGPPDAVRLKAFRDHLGRMRTWERKFEPLNRAGTQSDLNFSRIQAQRIQAEAWVARELHKPQEK